MKIKKNIISWYPFEKNCTILQFNCNSTEITKLLCQYAKKVVLYEKNRERVAELKEENKNINNLRVVDNIKSVTSKYDYIVIIGLENIIEETNILFADLKKILNPNGKMLVAMDNKYSVKNISTQEGINRILKDNHIHTIEEVGLELKSAGFENQKIYYPFTDYKFTNILFTDEKPISQNELVRNLVYNNEETIKMFDENTFINKMIEDKIEMKKYANSFLIEVFNGEYVENEVRLVAFSNIRKNKYKIKTIVKKDYIYKYADNDESIKHIEDIKRNIDVMKNSKLKTVDTYDDEKIISKYIDIETFDRKVLDALRKDQNEGIELIIKFKKNIENCMEKANQEYNVFDKYNIKYNKEKFKKIDFIKYGLWDLIFQNCFYINDEFYFYDQEWIEENIPIDFIMYRAIKYCGLIGKYIENQELFKICNISEYEIVKFEELDNVLQEKIRNNEIWNLQKKGKTTEQMRIQKLTDNHTINLLNIEIAKKNTEINMRDEEIQNLKNQIAFMKQSVSWRITAPLRRIKKITKKNKD